MIKFDVSKSGSNLESDFVQNEEEIRHIKEILASSHINFLFGAGVNGSSFPQLKNFLKTNGVLEEYINDDKMGFEEKLNQLDEKSLARVINIFCDEFNSFVSKIDFENSSIANIRNMFSALYEIVTFAENRQSSMKKINIFTLNYDSIIEKALDELGYFNNVITVDRLNKIPVFDVIGYNIESKREITTFAIAKLHGTAKNDFLKPDQIIYPGNKKYETSMAPNFFQVLFKLKSELMKFNSVLFVIGYSGMDEHINKFISESLDQGLTVIWFKYSKFDYVPDSIKNKAIIVEASETPVDTTYKCYQIFKRVIDNVSK